MYKRLWPVIVALILNCGLLLPLVAGAAEEAEKATETSRQAMLGKELDSLQQEQKLLQQQVGEIGLQLRQAPDLVTQMRKEIGLLEKQSVDPRMPKTADALEAAIELLDAQVKAMQINLSDVMDRISEQQALPTLAREQVSGAQKQIQDLQDRVRIASQSDQTLPDNHLQAQVLRQQLTNANLRKDVAQGSLEGYQKLLELYTVNRDLLLLRMSTLKTALGLLRNERDSLRQKTGATEQAASEQQQETQGDMPAEVVKQLEINRRLIQKLDALVDGVTQASDRLVDGKQDLQDVRYRYEIAQQQLQLTDFHQYVDDYLLRQRQSLQTRIKELESSTDLTRQISEARLDQFKYDDDLHQVRTAPARERVIERLLKKSDLDEQSRASISMELQDVLQQREEILSKLLEANAKYVVSLTNLELLVQDQLAERIRFFELLNQKLMWRRSGKPLDWKWVTNLPSSVEWFVLHPGWRELVTVWYRALVKPVWPLLGVLVAAGLLYWPRARFIQRLVAVRDRIGNVMKDQFRYTAEALAITLFLAAPVPLLIVLVAYPLTSHAGATPFTNSVGEAMVSLARWVVLLEFVRALCRKNGLAVAHFSWRPSAIKALQRWIPVLYWQMPWVFVFSVVWSDGDEEHAGLLGRAAYICMALLFWLFVWRLLHPQRGITQQDEGREMHWYQRWNKQLYWFALLVPTALIVMALRGFNFSAMILHVHLYQTFMLAFMIFVLDQVFTRWFAVQERKIALERALSKREAIKKVKEQQEAAKSSGEGVPDVELHTIDVATISEQNRVMLRVVSFAAFAAALVWVWQDIFQAAHYFNEVVLWSYGVESADGIKQVPVSLGTLLITLVAIALTYVGVKNLPGLIEVMVLKRFSLDSGVRFAVTTTARYLVFLGGIMAVSTLIGLDWSKLGWLVAALGVGLGFGLQEIFANFVSGLIILYERPIRIGDTVTINDLSGTVARIRMRATTITDWDQKEIIIPNKTFVTSQFINWTLSSEVTRLVVKVGVAYGSNTQLVADTLLEIGKAHEMVLKEPAPTAWFLGFGDSALNFELRVFIEQFNYRLMLLHQLNSEIDRRFRELGVSIAFPQLDVHVVEMPRAEGPPAQKS